MRKNILITGIPKSGKSTLLKKVISNIQNKVGFVTNEILGENGRVGFEMETHLGNKETLAHINFKTPHKVSRYFVDIKNLESLIPEVFVFNENDFLYLDEVGQMELFSEEFKGMVTKFLDSRNTCLITLSAVYSNDFIESIKKRHDIILVEITPENREEKAVFITQLIGKIEKAKKYLTEPERFTQKGNSVVIQGDHEFRTVTLGEDGLTCNCNFFNKNNNHICSHTIAVSEFIEK